MHSLLSSALFSRGLSETAAAWQVTPGQAADLFRRFPFFRMSSASGRGKRGRPGRHVSLDGSWSFFPRNPRRPLTHLLALLRELHECGEPFALGLPLTSAYLRPFLFPQVRLYAPLETVSVWRGLFGGDPGVLEVSVEVFEGGQVTESEGLPVLGPEAAAVDALVAYRRFHAVTLLALADCLLHESGGGNPVPGLAGRRGLGPEWRALRAHRGSGPLSKVEVRAAHERYRELRQQPPTSFSALATSREAYS